MRVFLERDFRQGQGKAEGDGGLAGKAQNRQAIAPIGGDADFADLKVEGERINKPRAWFCAFRQHHDAAVVFGKLKLRFGADHAQGQSPAQLGFFNGQPAGQGRAHRGHGHFLPGRHIGRAANDIQNFRPAHIHTANFKLVRVRVLLATKRMADDQPGKMRKRPFNALKLKPLHGQPVAEFLNIALKRHKFPQPVKT